MQTFLLVIHAIIALAIVAIVLLQRSEGGALGIGGGGGGMMSARGKANLMTRTTAWLAALFMVSSLALAYMAGSQKQAPSFIEQIGSGATSSQQAPTANDGPAAPTDNGLPVGANQGEEGMADPANPAAPID